METKVKHTPRTWTAKPITGTHDYRIFEGRYAVADIYATMETGRTVDANAHLIAAAPDLLEACKEALIGLEQLFSADGTLGDRLRQAIAKAEGNAK